MPPVKYVPVLSKDKVSRTLTIGEQLDTPTKIMFRIIVLIMDRFALVHYFFLFPLFFYVYITYMTYIG